MWESGTPRSGTRIIAPYNDGSGAKLFAVVEDDEGGIQLIDSDGDEYDADYLTGGERFGLWACLPEGSKLWCELTSNEPINLDF
jgi:hypothetical protein